MLQILGHSDNPSYTLKRHPCLLPRGQINLVKSESPHFPDDLCGNSYDPKLVSRMSDTHLASFIPTGLSRLSTKSCLLTDNHHVATCNTWRSQTFPRAWERQSCLSSSQPPEIKTNITNVGTKDDKRNSVRLS